MKLEDVSGVSGLGPFSHLGLTNICFLPGLGNYCARRVLYVAALDNKEQIVSS